MSSNRELSVQSSIAVCTLQKTSEGYYTPCLESLTVCRAQRFSIFSGLYRLLLAQNHCLFSYSIYADYLYSLIWNFSGLHSNIWQNSFLKTCKESVSAHKVDLRELQAMFIYFWTIQRAVQIEISSSADLCKYVYRSSSRRKLLNISLISACTAFECDEESLLSRNNRWTAYGICSPSLTVTYLFIFSIV